MRDVVLDERVCLDMYCDARVKFWARGIQTSYSAEQIVGFLAKISNGTAPPKQAGVALPRLLEALPPMQQLAVLMAGVWLDDTDEVVDVAMHLSGYMCAHAARQTTAWFNSNAPKTHIGCIQ
jgi:hypothetical protein